MSVADAIHEALLQISESLRISAAAQAQTQSIKGDAGPPGKSAYELWLADGNTGTLADFWAWLRSGGTPPPPVVTESANATTLPGLTSSITDASGAAWTLRMSDRAVLKNGATTSLSGVVQLWYLNGVIWAYMGSGWKSWSGSAWSATSGWRVKPTGFPTTAGLRYPAGPKTLTSFSGIQIAAGASIQNIVNANPAGTTYVLAVGTYPQQSVTPKNGDTFIGLYNGTSGAVLDGANTTGAAFSGTASNVTIRNLSIKRYAPPTQYGQISFTGGSFLTVQDCDISATPINCGAGVSITEHNYALLVGTKLRDNNQEGYAVHGDFNAQIPIIGCTFDNVEIYGNNPTAQQWSGSEQGGGKALNTQYHAVWFCESRDNGGSAFWTDYDNIWTTYWYNKIKGTNWNGIEHEISFDAEIIGNDFTEFYTPFSPGFFSEAAIFMGNSQGVDPANKIVIANNRLAITAPNQENARLICFRQQTRTLGNHYLTGQARRLANISVVDNIIVANGTTVRTDGLIGMVQDTGATDLFSASDRPIFDRQNYTVTEAFKNMWATNNSLMNYPQWQAAGHEANGVYSGPLPPPPAAEWAVGNGNIAFSGTPKLIATGGGSAGVNYTARGSDLAVISGTAKRFWKITATNIVASGFGVGVANASLNTNDNAYLGQDANSLSWYPSGAVYKGGSQVGTLPAYVEGNVLTLAVDRATGKLWGAVGGNPNTATGGVDIPSGDVYPAINLQTGDIATAEFVGATGGPAGFTAYGG